MRSGFVVTVNWLIGEVDPIGKYVIAKVSVNCEQRIVGSSRNCVELDGGLGQESIQKWARSSSSRSRICTFMKKAGWRKNRESLAGKSSWNGSSRTPEKEIVFAAGGERKQQVLRNRNQMEFSSRSRHHHGTGDTTKHAWFSSSWSRVFALCRSRTRRQGRDCPKSTSMKGTGEAGRGIDK